MSAVLEQTTEKLMTVDEFYESPYSEGFELVEGKIVPKWRNIALSDSDMPTGALHGSITSRLQFALSSFVYGNDLGEIFAAETGFKLSAKTSRGADIAFVNKEKIQEYGIPEKYFPCAPDIAIEVVSPGNSSEELLEKADLYLKSGTLLVWIVYPKTKLVQVYRSNNVISLLREKDILEGENVLPNFQLPLSQLFGNIPQASK